jgi:two-component sensor histidine kinase
MIGACVDISRRKKTEFALAANERRLRRAHIAGGIGDWEINLETSETTWSESQFALLGIAPTNDRIVREQFEALIHPRDYPRVMQDVAVAMKSGRFETDFRVRMPGGNYRWLASRGEVQKDASGVPRWMVGINFDVTELRRSMDQQVLLINELNHRVKNTLAMVQSFSQMTLKTHAGIDFQRVFMGRINALAAAHDLLTQARWTKTTLSDLVSTALQPFKGELEPITWSGGVVPLDPRTTINLVLVLHELATNAVKYGALSTAEGTISIRWIVADDRRVEIDWRETGGPPIERPVLSGFGSRLIAAILRDLTGEIVFDFEPDGLRCRLTLPVQASEDLPSLSERDPITNGQMTTFP